MRGKLGDKIPLPHVLEAIGEVESYLLEKDFNEFMSNSMMRFACIKQMEIIGEASNHVSESNSLSSWNFYFTNGFTYTLGSKVSAYYVRAVRAF